MCVCLCTRVCAQEGLQIDPDGRMEARQFLVVFAYALRGLGAEDRPVNPCKSGP